MAMIHLYYLGYTSADMSDFTLTLTNPSTQQDLLIAELLREKAQTYTELTRIESGIAAMSHTTAKRKVFNMSDSEIVDDLRQQKMEKVVMQEFADAPVKIKKSGLFTDIDDRYAEPDATILPAGEEGLPPTDAGAGVPPSPELGGMDAGMGIPPPPVPGLPNQSPADLPPMAESNRRKKKMSDKAFDSYINKLVGGVETEKNKSEKRIMLENQNRVTTDNSIAENMVNEINVLLETHGKINNTPYDDADEDVIDTIIPDDEIDDMEENNS